MFPIGTGCCTAGAAESQMRMGCVPRASGGRLVQCKPQAQGLVKVRYIAGLQTAYGVPDSFRPDRGELVDHDLRLRGQSVILRRRHG